MLMNKIKMKMKLMKDRCVVNIMPNKKGVIIMHRSKYWTLTGHPFHRID